MSTLGIAITAISSVSTVAASAAAILAGINHAKVKNVQTTVNGRLREALEMIAKATEALAVSEAKRHAANDESKGEGIDNTT